MWRAVLLLLLVGCTEGRPDAPAPARAELGDAVAVVEGQRISREEVARFAASTGLPPSAALRALIDERLLVAYAQRRGYGELAEIERGLDRARVRALLRAELGDASTDDVAAQRAELERELAALRARTPPRYDDAAIERVFQPPAAPSDGE